CHPSSTTDPKKSSGRSPWTKTPRTPRAPKPNAPNNAGNTSVADRPPPRRTPARSTPSRKNSERTAKADPAALRTHLTGPDRTPPTPQPPRAAVGRRPKARPAPSIVPGGSRSRRYPRAGPFLATRTAPSRGGRRLGPGGFGVCGGTACSSPGIVSSTGRSAVGRLQNQLPLVATCHCTRLTAAHDHLHARGDGAGSSTPVGGQDPPPGTWPSSSSTGRTVTAHVYSNQAR